MIFFLILEYFEHSEYLLELITMLHFFSYVVHILFYGVFFVNIFLKVFEICLVLKKKKKDHFIGDSMLRVVSRGFGVRNSNPGFTKCPWISYLTFLTLRFFQLKIRRNNSHFSVFLGDK